MLNARPSQVVLTELGVDGCGLSRMGQVTLLSAQWFVWCREPTEEKGCTFFSCFKGFQG
jgi:hypothetical protein